MKAAAWGAAARGLWGQEPLLEARRRSSDDASPTPVSRRRQALLRGFRNMLSRRGVAAMVTVLLSAVVRYTAPPHFYNLGRFGAEVSEHLEASVLLQCGQPKLVASSFLSMMPDAYIDRLLVSVASVSGAGVEVKPIVYDHEGYLLRSGSPVYVAPWPNGSWYYSEHFQSVTLPLETRLQTATGRMGQGQSFFLGVVIGCSAGGGGPGHANVSLALGREELYPHRDKMPPRIAAHMVTEAAKRPHLDFVTWERLKHNVKKMQPGGTGEAAQVGGGGGGPVGPLGAKEPARGAPQEPGGAAEPGGSHFLAIQGLWYVEQDTWKACFVVIWTLFAIILITDGMPAFMAFAGLEVFFMLTGILSAHQAVAGFAQEGILTVAVFLIVARALDDISFVEETLVRVLGSPKSLRRAQLQMVVPVTVMSAIVPNTAIISMMIPILNRWAMRLGIAPAQLMMPLSFASLLGSNLTLIGSAANLIAASVFSTVEIGMFDLTAKGLLIMVVGLAYLVLAAPLLLDTGGGGDQCSQSHPSVAAHLQTPLGLAPVHETDDVEERDLVALQGVRPQLGVAADKTAAWRMPVAYKLRGGRLGQPSIEIISSLPGGFGSPTPESPEPGRRNGVQDSSDDESDWLARSVPLIVSGAFPAAAGALPIVGTATLGGMARQTTPGQLARARLYVVLFVVEAGGPLANGDLQSTGILRVEGANLVEVLSDTGAIVYPASSTRWKVEGFGEQPVLLQGGYLLRFRVTPAGYHNLRNLRGLRASPGTAGWLRRLGAGRRKRTLVEAVVQDTSSTLFSGSGIVDGKAFLSELRAVILSVRRGPAGNFQGDGALVGADNWHGATVRQGDVLLLDARDMGRHVEARSEFLLVRVVRDTNPPRVGGVGDSARAFLGLALLLGFLIVTSVPQWQVSPLMAAWVVAALYLAFDLLSIEQMLETLSARLAALLTLMTAIGVGEAFRASGVVHVLSHLILRIAEAVGRVLGDVTSGISFAIFLIVCNFAAFVNMGSAVAVMAPVVQQLVVDIPGVQLKPIALILMYAANSPFCTPFGATANLMVVASGKYSFADFVRFGLPLQVLVMVTAVGSDWLWSTLPLEHR